MMNMSSFQRLVRQLSTLAVFACSFVKTIVNNNMPSHDKPLNIIELSVYFFLEVLCPFDLARAVLLNNRHSIFGLNCRIPRKYPSPEALKIEA